MTRTDTPDRPLAVLLMGPTATGKTALAVALARTLPVEIISVDSAMVYRGLDVGTAKPSPALRAEVPHRLIDIVDPVERYSAARFRRDARDAMADITRAGRIPLLAGGTMLYFRALQYGLSPLPGAHPEVRHRLEAEARASGWDVLHRRLASVDPAAARRIHPNDPQRIQRALEVYEITGRPMTELYGRTVAENLPYRLLKFAVEPPERTELHRRIAERFRGMLAGGLIDEVTRLFERGDLRGSEPALRAVGYRQVWQYLAGEVSRADMEARAIKATRQLARRQMTWLRSESGLHWLAGGHTEAVRVISGAVRDARP